MVDISTASRLMHSWQRCHRLPGGRFFFSRMLARTVPYSGSIRPQVEELAPGDARVRMKDRPHLRNHLSSIHAIALTNLGELTSGLAMMAALPGDMRGIPVELNIEFVKKARGDIVAHGHSPTPIPGASADYKAQAILEDSEGDTVARLTARWVVSPRS